MLVLRRGNEAVTTTPEIRAFLHGPDPLIVTKANAKSVVHRRIYLDYVGVKTYSQSGALTGELRIVGLFTSTAYTRSVMKIPYLRSKAEAVIARSGFNPGDHSGKALINVLESYPRDELFQVAVPTLRKHAEAILALGERPRVRVLVRVDQFDRFVSVLVFVPRDRYDSRVREKIGHYLKTVFEGRLSAYYPAFPEGSLARVHFIIGRSGGKTPKVEQSRLEAGIRDIVRTWEDALAEAAVGGNAGPQLTGIASRFPESYRGSFSAAEALRDADRIVGLDASNPITIDYYRHADQDESQAALKIYHFGSPVALSRRVPVLENMGFRVISERTFEVGDDEGDKVFIHDMELDNAFARPIDLADGGALFEDVFLSVWRGLSDNDGYNALAQTAGLWSREIGILRAYGRYLQQAGIPQSQGFIAAALNRYPQLARALFTLFVTRFDPSNQAEAEVTAKHLKAKIRDALDEVPNIDDDTIIRRYLNLIESSLRTNHFAPETYSGDRSLAIKLDSRAVDGLPEPRPVARDLCLWARGRRRAFALRPRGARRPALVRPGTGLSHRSARPGQGAAGEERGDRAGRRQGRLLSEAPAGGRQPRRRVRGRHQGLCQLRLQPAVDHRQSRRRRGDPAEGCGPPRQGRSLFRGRRRQGHGDVFRYRQCDQPEIRVLARRRLRFGRLGRLRPQEDGHHRARRLGSGEAAFPRDEPRHPDLALHRGRRRRHVGRRVRQRHAAVGTDQADRRLRPPRHLHRSRSRHGGLDGGAASHVRAAALELAGLRQVETVERRRRSSRAARSRWCCRPRRPRRSGSPRRRPRRPRS